MSKAQAAKEKQAAERAEAAAKKAEAKKLAAEEEEEMARLSQKKAAAAKSKVCTASPDLRPEEEVLGTRHAALTAEELELAAEVKKIDWSRICVVRICLLPTQVTAAQLAKTKEADTKARAAAVAKQDAFKKREVAADDYATLVDVSALPCALNLRRQPARPQAAKSTRPVAARSCATKDGSSAPQPAAEKPGPFLWGM